MASLRRLINHSVENKNQEDIQTLGKFSKNYLPILFNLYSTKPHGSDEEGQRHAAFETIKVNQFYKFVYLFLNYCFKLY